MAGRCTGLGQALLSQQLAQQACVSTIRFRPLLAPPQGCRVGRLGQMGLVLGSHQLFDDEPPASAALDGKRDVVAALEPLQPIPQRWACGRADLARGHLTGVRVYVIERDLCSVHVKATYNCHWGPPRAPDSRNSVCAVPRGSLHMPSFFILKSQARGPDEARAKSVPPP